MPLTLLASQIDSGNFSGSVVVEIFVDSMDELVFPVSRVARRSFEGFVHGIAMESVKCLFCFEFRVEMKS